MNDEMMAFAGQISIVRIHLPHSSFLPDPPQAVASPPTRKSHVAGSISSSQVAARRWTWRRRMYDDGRSVGRGSRRRASRQLPRAPRAAARADRASASSNRHKAPGRRPERASPRRPRRATKPAARSIVSSAAAKSPSQSPQAAAAYDRASRRPKPPEPAAARAANATRREANDESSVAGPDSSLVIPHSSFAPRLTPDPCQQHDRCRNAGQPCPGADRIVVFQPKEPGDGQQRGGEPSREPHRLPSAPGCRAAWLLVVLIAAVIVVFVAGLGLGVARRGGGRWLPRLLPGHDAREQPPPEGRHVLARLRWFALAAKCVSPMTTTTPSPSTRATTIGAFDFFSKDQLLSIAAALDRPGRIERGLPRAVVEHAGASPQRPRLDRVVAGRNGRVGNAEIEIGQQRLAAAGIQRTDRHSSVPPFRTNCFTASRSTAENRRAGPITISSCARPSPSDARSGAERGSNPCRISIRV